MADFAANDRGLLWNLTFDHVTEKSSDGTSGRSRMAAIDRHRIRAERLHPKATNWRCRPIAVDTSSEKRTFDTLDPS